MPFGKKTPRQFLIDKALEFDQEELILMALTHPSYSQERNTAANNQRLEFLGDAVLNLVVAEYLYKHFTNKAEGELTKIRARVVCEKALVTVAGMLDLGLYLLLGRGEEMSGGRRRNSILADATEAVIGAIYLDKGYETARDFTLQYLQEIIEDTARGDYYDYKSRLQEMVQARDKDNVSYAIVEEHGPAHAKTFVIGVYYKGSLLATGSGKSKKEAEQNAAQSALANPFFLEGLSKGKGP
ncbi:MAG TPA: ribonuclease III [Syntrophomonadaceae bacterium]|nr:ribonuclease III [Syntrophomonadaceae bacterium]